MEQATRWARRWIELSAQAIVENREELSELDRHIGDGDHGENLARGFRAILESGQVLAAQTGREVLQLTAKTLMFTVGGAAGPLYGTAYLHAAKAFPECLPTDSMPTNSPTGRLTSEAIVEIFTAAAEGIQTRGKAKAREKTMVDAWLPAVAAARQAAAAGLSVPQTLWAAVDGANQGALSTIPLRATKGRASYLGERSVGHLDPGAKSSALIFKAAAQAADIFEENQ